MDLLPTGEPTFGPNEGGHPPGSISDTLQGGLALHGAAALAPQIHCSCTHWLLEEEGLPTECHCAYPQGGVLSTRANCSVHFPANVYLASIECKVRGQVKTRKCSVGETSLFFLFPERQIWVQILPLPPTM